METITRLIVVSDKQEERERGKGKRRELPKDFKFQL